MAVVTVKRDGQPRTVIIFFFFGLLAMIYDEIARISAQDVLAGSDIATTTVVISIATSVLAMKLTVPWVMQSVPYLFKITIIISLLLSGLLTLVCSREIQFRLLGISIMEAGVSTSEITFMSMTAFYDPITASALVAGIGMSSLVGPFYYTAFTTWLDWSPRTTMSLTTPWPLFYLILYALLNKEPLQSSTRNEVKLIQNKTLENEKGEKKQNDNSNEGRSLESIPEEMGQSKTDCTHKGEKDKNEYSLKELNQVMQHKNDKIENEDNMDEHSRTNKPNQNELTTKLKTAVTISPFIFFLLVTYFSEYLANHAVITTLAFPSDTISPRDHYPYYMLTYHIGKFLGRSHIFLITCFSPGLLKYVLIKRTWILALISFIHLLIFLSLSWYRYVSHISFVIIFCISEGFTAGSMYVNSVHAVTEAIEDIRQKEFALGLLTVGDATGKLLAGITGLWNEPMLKKHCLEELKLGIYCFTRHSMKKSWTDSQQ